MKDSPPKGFTLIELMVSMLIGIIVLGGIYGILSSSNILIGKSLAMNTTGNEARMIVDRAQQLLSQAYTIPRPIDANGVVLSSTLTITGTAAVASGMAPVVSGTPTVTGTGAGVFFYRALGGSYLALVGTAGLSATASTVDIQRDTTAQQVPELPLAGDIICINTTSLMSGTGFQVWATVNGNPTLKSSSGTLQTYNVPLKAPMTVAEGTTSTGISYSTTNTRESSASWYTIILRPTALLISSRNSATEFGLLNPAITNGVVTATSGSVSTSSNYQTLSRQIDSTAARSSLFCIVSYNSAFFVSLRLGVRSSDYDNYLSKKQVDGYNTFMGLSTLIDLKSKP